MARAPRLLSGGVIYHLLNRATAGQKLFDKKQDYQAFFNIMMEGREFMKRRAKIDIYAFALMPNHWHIVAKSDQDGALSNYLKWVCGTHGQRSRFVKESSGRGHLYQSRFKSFPVSDDAYFLTLCRYVERNPIRAGLSRKATEWPWTSAAYRKKGAEGHMSEWPLPYPKNWEKDLENAFTYKEREEIQISILRGRPYGDQEWVLKISKKLQLEQTLKPVGRPRNGV